MNSVYFVAIMSFSFAVLSIFGYVSLLSQENTINQTKKQRIIMFHLHNIQQKILQIKYQLSDLVGLNTRYYSAYCAKNDQVVSIIWIWILSK